MRACVPACLPDRPTDPSHLYTCTNATTHRHSDAAVEAAAAHERVTPLWALLALLPTTSTTNLPPTDAFRPPNPSSNGHGPLRGAAVSLACLPSEQRAVFAPLVEGMGGWALTAPVALAWAG